MSYLRLALMMIAVCATALPAQALGQKELQQLLDGNGPLPSSRASNDGFTEIDLSDFTEPITETLYVRNQNIRFVNGTLKQELYQDFTLIQIQNGYELELAATASLVGTNYPSNKNNPFIDIQNGELIISGGSITGIFNVNRPHDFGNGNVFFTSERNIAVELSGGKQSGFHMSSGSVEGTIKNSEGGHLEIYDGNIDHILLTKGTCDLSGTVTVNDFVEPRGTSICLISSLQQELKIDGYEKDQMIISGREYTLLAPHRRTSRFPHTINFYTLKESDVEKITLVNNVNNYKLYLGEDGYGNYVYVREAGIDYSNITNEDDLQKALDEIAAQRPSELIEVKINSAGIDLTKRIKTAPYCKATITGGPIRVVGDGNSHFNGDYLFFVNEKVILNFQDIVIDFKSCTLNGRAFWVLHDGTLSISSGTEYQNVISDIVKGDSEFYFNDGTLFLDAGRLPMIHGRIFSNGYPWDAGNLYSHITYLDGDLFEQPRAHNCPGSKIIFYGNINTQWTFEGQWQNYTLEKPFIMTKGDDMAASSYWHMKFDGLPSTEYKRTVYYDGSSHSVKLKTYKSLQDMMDGDEDGNVDIPCDGVDVGENYTPAQRMQWILDGSDCPSAVIDPPTIWLPGGCMFYEHPTIARYITFDSFSSGHRLYIRNKTEFKDKVVARNFIWFSIIEQDGHLIWDNAETENVLYPIYNTGGTAEVKGGNLTGTVYNAGTLILCGCVQVNEIQVLPQSIIRVTSPITSTWVLDLTVDETVDYPNGCILLEGGNGHTLTADDFAHLQFRLPAGCSVTYDPTHNVVVLDSASDIHNIQADPTATHKGVYTLDGRKLQGQAKVKGVYIVNGQKAVVK